MLEVLGKEGGGAVHPSWGPCDSEVLAQFVANSPAEMLEGSMGIVPLTVLDSMASGDRGLSPTIETELIAEVFGPGWVRLRLGPVFQC